MAKKTALGYDERLKRCANLTVLEVADVAVMLNISEGYLRHLISDRAIPFYRNDRGLISFRKDEIEAWQLGERVHTASELQSKAVTHIAISNR